MLRDLIRVIQGQLSSSALWDAQKLAEDNAKYIAELNHTIRGMDQLIFDMSQKTSFDAMRPFFNKLQSGQEYRMNLESKRIKSLVVKEIERTYQP